MRRDEVPAVPGEGVVVGSLRPLLHAAETVIRVEAKSVQERVAIWYITYSVIEDRVTLSITAAARLDRRTCTMPSKGRKTEPE